MKKIPKNMAKRISCAIMAAMLMMMTACEADGNLSSAAQDMAQAGAEATVEDNAENTGADVNYENDSEKNYEIIENHEDGAHAITADGETADYSAVEVIKTGEADGDEADFYGENSAVFATNGATLTLSDIKVTTDGTHANAVFSYGEGTTVNVSDSEIETSGNCSGGIMTTGSGTMNAENLTIHTTGNSSAAIRSDRGGGTVNVTGGSYSTDGTGSPAIYSTADITVNDAELSSTASQGVVVEGQNSVTLNNVNLAADNNTKNSDKSDYYQAVMIYQSMSGDADEGTAEFTMNGGTLTNANGDIFFVNNTVATINLKDAQITNNGDGVFLRAAAAGWGNEGSNGGHVTLNASSQEIDGDMLIDDISSLNLYLSDGSEFNGAITTADPSGAKENTGDVYVELSGGSKWILSADSYITSLTCEADSIDLNGNRLYVNGEEYAEGTASKGEAIKVEIKSSQNGGRPEPPDGEMPGDGKMPENGGKPGDGKMPENGGKPGDGKISENGIMPGDGKMPKPALPRTTLPTR